MNKIFINSLGMRCTRRLEGAGYCCRVAFAGCSEMRRGRGALEAHDNAIKALCVRHFGAISPAKLASLGEEKARAWAAECARNAAEG